MKRALTLHLLLGATIAIGACGGGAETMPPPQPPGAPSASAAPSASTEPAPGPSGSATATTSAPAGSSSSAVGTSPPSAVEMKPVVASAMLADVQALGLDPKKLPPIEKLNPKQLRGVMKLMAKAVGGKCADCHTEGDFGAPTRRKKIAAKMWDEFVAKLSMDGQPIFCDSCHEGRFVQLDRSDKKALQKWMDANFVQKLKRADGKDEECESCHVDWDMKFLAKWGQ